MWFSNTHTNASGETAPGASDPAPSSVKKRKNRNTPGGSRATAPQRSTDSPKEPKDVAEANTEGPHTQIFYPCWRRPMMNDHKIQKGNPAELSARAGHPDFIFLTKEKANKDTVAAVFEIKHWWSYSCRALKELYSASITLEGRFDWERPGGVASHVARQVCTSLAIVLCLRDTKGALLI